MVSLPLSLCVCVCACVFVGVGGWACACVGGERFSNSNRIIPSDYRILLLLKMPIPSAFMYPYFFFFKFVEKTKQKRLQNYRIKVFFLKYNSDDFSEFLIKYKYFSNYLLIIL